MLTFDAALTGLLLLAIALIVTVLVRPNFLQRASGRIVAFFGFVLLPLVSLWAGTVSQLEHSKTTDFCMSCHVMEPYGESLMLDDDSHLPAGHFQNHRVPRETACFDCHTSYTMYGDIEAKLKGVAHLWVNYIGTLPEKIELYEPYNNRDCLHCHQASRTFLENEIHTDDLKALVSNELSCMECHDLVHSVDELDDLPRWAARPQENR